MIRCRYLLVAALLSSTSAFAAGNVTLTDQNNQYFGTQANPLWVTGGGGGSGGAYTGATATAPGTNGTTATPVQGVDGGKAVAVTWTGQTVGVTGTVQLGVGSAAIGSVSVSNFPSTQTVSGTVAATQSGAYTVTQGPAGASAWKVDGSGVTQPVSAASLPLPAGAATSTNQTNVQSAPGTSAGTALTIQGVSNGVAIPTTPTNAATVATAANQNSTAAGTSATNAQAVQGVTGGVAVPVSGTVTANLGTIAGAATASGQVRNTQFTDYLGQAVAASATQASAVRTVPSNVSTYNVTLTSSQAGTLTLYGCTNADCTTGLGAPLITQSVTAGAYVSLKFNTVGGYMQFRYVNGSSAATIYAISSFTAN